MHDKDEAMHVRIKNKPKNDKSLQNTKLSSQEIDRKIRLIEIYLIISGLLVSGLQISNTLISTPSNSTFVIPVENIKYLTHMIPLLNVVFVFLIISILLYYNVLSSSLDLNLIISAYVSLFFSYMITAILDMQDLIRNHNVGNLFF